MIDQRRSGLLRTALGRQTRPQPASTNGSENYQGQLWKDNTYAGGKVWNTAYSPVAWGSMDHRDFVMTVTFVCCPSGCTYTQGYWKNHAEAWPAETLSLGTTSYTKAQLLSILGQPVSGGNGLVALAHQLIAAKLNIANGADATALGTAIADADALIGALVIPPVGSGYLHPSLTSALTATLANYNEGLLGPGHCPN